MTTSEDNNGYTPPAFGGPVTEIKLNDVLCGRGGRIAQHSGNLYFRDLVRKYRSTYLSKEIKKKHKIKIASKIVQTIRNLDPPGRFLREQQAIKGPNRDDNDEDGGSVWLEIGDEKANKKAGQAMREKIDEGRRGDTRQQNLMFEAQQLDLMGCPNVESSSFPTSPQTTTTTMTSQSRHDAYHSLQETSTLLPMMATTNPSSHSYAQYGQQYTGPTNQEVDHSTNCSHAPSASYFCGNTMPTNQSYRSQHCSNISNHLTDSTHDDSFQSTLGFVEPLNYSEESAASNISSWDDSWDQGMSMDSFQLVSTSSRRSVLPRTESARRRQFQMMKDESSSIPTLEVPPISHSPSNEEKIETNINDFNENELMKGSLVSMDMHSSLGLSGDITVKKSLNLDLQSKSGELQKSMNMMETTMSMNDIRMDSLMTSLTSLVMSGD